MARRPLQAAPTVIPMAASSSSACNTATRCCVLPDQALNLPAGQTVEIEAVAPWTTAKYMESRSAESVFAGIDVGTFRQVTDTLQTRFGFREFWAEGDSLFLNGNEAALAGDFVLAAAHRRRATRPFATRCSTSKPGTTRRFGCTLNRGRKPGTGLRTRWGC